MCATARASEKHLAARARARRVGPRHSVSFYWRECAEKSRGPFVRACLCFAFFNGDCEAKRVLIVVRCFVSGPRRGQIVISLDRARMYSA